MNTSRKTRIIADGIARYAAYADTNQSRLVTPEEIAWVEWQCAYPQWVNLVRQEQWDLFDRVNDIPDETDPTIPMGPNGNQRVD